MASKLTARIIHIHDTEANWNKIPEFIPKQGEIIIYDIDETHLSPRFKIGDGISTIGILPFGLSNALEEVLEWEDDVGYIDAGNISSYE